MLFAELKLGDDAPNFYAQILDGGNFYLSEEIAKNRPIVLSFFATWCHPCLKEIPELNKMRNIYPEIDGDGGSTYTIDYSNVKEGATVILSPV